MNFILETERLVLRAWERDDVESLLALASDEETMRYIGNGRPWDIVRAREWLGWMEECYRERGYGRWAVVEKDGGRLVGSCGFYLVLEKVDFGYMFARDCWGRGYATEVGRAALRHGFESLNFREVVARTAPENQASRRVLEKLGFEFRGLVYHEFDRETVASYLLRRADFNAGQV